MKRKTILLSVALATFLATSITVLAASCPACEASGVQATCTMNSQHLWHQAKQHTVEYSENGVLKTETCTITFSEDKVSWVCPNGHGTVSSMTHHKETHSGSHCNNLDYYY